MPELIALVRLPAATLAPGYRQSLSARSHFKVEDVEAGVVGVAPYEGAGGVASHFSLTRICDAETDLAKPDVWEPIRRNPPRRRSDVDPVAYRDRLLARGSEILARNSSVEAEIVAFSLAAMGAAETGELESLLLANLPPLFEQFPRGSLWQVSVDAVLLARLAFGRAQLAFELTPDLPLGEEMEQLRALSELTMTRGVDFGAIMNVPLIALSPAVLGFLVPSVPHVLVFCFGSDVDLRRPYPTSYSSLYRPNVLNDADGLDRSAFLMAPQPDDGPRLLAWWVERLNELFSHATDPTRFTEDETGYYDAPSQAAWMITLERLIGDAVSLLAEPQGTDLDRVQIAFDLLDKAESLLGYTRKKTGKGFEALLRRSQSLPRIREAYGSLPDDLASRLGDEVERLFEGLYREVRANTLSYRLTPNGARIAFGSADELHAVSNDTLVSTFCRAVRNSSHGVLDMLKSHDDRFLLAANTGGIPAELPALAPLIALSLLADTAGLVDGTWRTRLLR
jgi:hypothetical protein